MTKRKRFPVGYDSGSILKIKDRKKIDIFEFVYEKPKKKYQNFSIVKYILEFLNFYQSYFSYTPEIMVGFSKSQPQ